MIRVSFWGFIATLLFATAALEAGGLDTNRAELRLFHPSLRVNAAGQVFPYYYRYIQWPTVNVPLGSVKRADSGNGTLEIDGSGLVTPAGSGESLITADGGTTLTLSGVLDAPDTDGNHNFVLDGTGTVLITGQITDLHDGTINTGSNSNITKAGVGELIISNGTNSNDDYWKGTTTISAGTLAIHSDTPDPGAGELKDGPTGNTITILNPGMLDVSDFSEYTVQIDQTIAGDGTVETGSAVFRALDATVLSSGNSVGTLTVDGNYKIEYPGEGNALGAGVLDTGKFQFELSDSAAGTSDQINVTGDLTMQIDSGVVSQLQIEVQAVDGALIPNSIYTLVSANDNHAINAQPGDANHDGVVNPTDLALLTLNWGKTGKNWENGDCNGDGVVNHLDLQTMVDNWLFDNRPSSATGGQGSNPSGAIAVFYSDIAGSYGAGVGPATIPEPTSAALLVLGGLAVSRRRRR